RSLGTLGGDTSYAHGINDAGQVVGTSLDAAGQWRGFLWQNGRLHDLGLPAGYGSCNPVGINAAGPVVGLVGGSGGNWRAFRWTPNVPNGTTGTMALLPQAVAGDWQEANAINAAGAVAGESAPPGYRFRPTVWSSDGGVAYLPLLPLHDYGYALSINDAGCV